MKKFYSKPVRFSILLVGISLLSIFSFQNCSNGAQFGQYSSFVGVGDAVPSPEVIAAKQINCRILGPNQVLAGNVAGPYTVSCDNGKVISKYAWACKGSEPACAKKSKSDDAEFSITPETFALFEKVPLQVEVESTDGLKAMAEAKFDVNPLPKSETMCGYYFRLNVEVLVPQSANAASVKVQMDLKNSNTCRCNVNAVLPGMTLVSPGRYRINGTTEEMTMSDLPTVDANTNVATCSLRCANSNNEPSVNPRGQIFCSSCKVPATIRETAQSPEIKTWEFIKDDAKKICYYTQMDHSSFLNLQNVEKNPAVAAAVRPTFKLRNSTEPNPNEPTTDGLGFSAGSLYYKMDPLTGTYTTHDAANYIPNCEYFSSSESYDSPGYKNPTTQVCTYSRYTSGGFDSQVQYDSKTKSINARYYWCRYRDNTYASGDCFYSQYGSGTPPGPGGGSGGGYNP